MVVGELCPPGLRGGRRSSTRCALVRLARSWVRLRVYWSLLRPGWPCGVEWRARYASARARCGLQAGSALGGRRCGAGLPLLPLPECSADPDVGPSQYGSACENSGWQKVAQPDSMNSFFGHHHEADPRRDSGDNGEQDTAEEDGTADSAVAVLENPGDESDDRVRARGECGAWSAVPSPKERHRSSLASADQDGVSFAVLRRRESDCTASSVPSLAASPNRRINCPISARARLADSACSRIAVKCPVSSVTLPSSLRLTRSPLIPSTNSRFSLGSSKPSKINGPRSPAWAPAVNGMTSTVMPGCSLISSRCCSWRCITAGLPIHRYSASSPNRKTASGESSCSKRLSWRCSRIWTIRCAC